MSTLMRCIYHFPKLKVVQEVTKIQDHDLLHQPLLQPRIQIQLARYTVSINVFAISWSSQLNQKLVASSLTLPTPIKTDNFAASRIVNKIIFSVINTSHEHVILSGSRSNNAKMIHCILEIWSHKPWRLFNKTPPSLPLHQDAT